MLIDLTSIFIFNVVIILCIYILNSKKIDFKNKRFYLAILFLNLLATINYNLNIMYLKPFINFMSLVFVGRIIMENKIRNSVVSSIMIYASILLSEIVILVFCMCVLGISSKMQMMDCINYLNTNTILSALATIVPPFISLYIFQNIYVKKFYNSVLMVVNKIEVKRVVPFSLFLFIIVLLMYIIIYYSNSLIATIIIFMIFLLLLFYILLKDLKVRNEYDETKEKYSTTKQSLLEYEDMIDKYRVNNHENKNQLLTIQNMIKHKENKVNEYIDNLVGNVYMNNEKTMADVSIIPAGGLRATIHTKLNIMDNKNIKYVLNIDRKLRIIDFDNISSDLNLKICKIVSIFIDNAIDEVETHKKDKIVNIEMYIDDNKLFFEVSNKFINNFDIDRISEKKYTTKSNGHGYGLTLAKEIIDSEKSLNNYKSIEDNIFTQILEVDLKK